MKNSIHFTLLLVFIAAGLGTIKAEVSYSVPLKGQEYQVGSLLNWSTLNEFNNHVFIIEKSIDGLDYQAIGEVKTIGNTSKGNRYRFLDVGGNDKKAYYRLRQIDIDGTASYSQTILMQRKLTNNYMILAMSNTVTNDRFTFSVDASIDGNMNYIVKNINGEIVQKAVQNLEFGINEITINVKDELEGVYFVVLNVNNEREQIVIRKVEDEVGKKENVASKKQANGG
jgi:hypothetical protein